MNLVPASLQSVYLDLLQTATHAPAAAVVTSTINGQTYLRAVERIGATRRTRHIGRADDPAARAEADALRDAAAQAKNRRTLVATLRRAGLAGPPASMGRALEALSMGGLFESGGIVLVGTAAYLCYAAALGRRMPSGLTTTQDIDLSVVSLLIAGSPRIDLLETLRYADPAFHSVHNSMIPDKPPSRFRAPDGLIVEVVTNLRRAGVSPVPIPQLGASAEALRFQDFLIENPQRAVVLHGSGVPVLIPDPARFGVHKLMLAQLRPTLQAARRRKDMDQARTLRDILLIDNPETWNDAVSDARERGAAWRKALDAGLRALESG